MNGTHPFFAQPRPAMLPACAWRLPAPRRCTSSRRQTGIRCLPVRCSAPAQPPLSTGARRMPAPRRLRRSAVAAPGMIEAVM